MLTLLFGVLLFLLFTVTGSILVCVFRVPKETLEKQPFSLIFPLIGAVALTCACEALLLLFPVKISAWLVLVLLIAGAVWRRKELGHLLKHMFVNPWPWLLLLFAAVVLAYPVLKQQGLVSIQSSNNDIIYYLSSIDWMKNHNIWAVPEFSNAFPYYGPADFMLKTTRIGTDVLGSFFSSVFFLEPHQVYFAMGIALNLSTISAIVFVLWHSCNLPKGYSLMMIPLLGCCFNWAQLQMLQYVPQIFGIGCMVGMIGFLLRQYREKSKGDIFFTALFIIGTVTVYAEFAFHILVIFVLIGIGMLLFTNDRKLAWKRARDTIKSGFLSFALCPVGLYKAVMFNLMLAGNLSTTENLDPYSGHMIPLSLMPKNLLGLAYQATDSTGIYGQILATVLCLLTIVSILIVLIRKHRAIDWIMLGILAFFAVYELFFRFSGFAYGEYKHIFSILPIVWMIAFYFCCNAVLLLKEKKIRYIATGIGTFFVAVLAVANLYSIKVMQPLNIYNYYNDDIFELRKQAEQMPEDTVYLITGTVNDLHRGVYALKDYSVKVTADSYFNFFKKQDEGELDPTCILYSGDTSHGMEDVYSQVPKVIWKNDLFMLTDLPLEAEPLGISLESGFSFVEIREDGAMRWTNDNESKIIFRNNSGEDAELNFSFLAQPAPGADKTIAVRLEDGMKIAQGDTKDQSVISCKIPLIRAGESIVVVIETNEPLTPAGGGDNRQLGIAFSHLEAELTSIES